MKRIYVNEKWCLGCHLCEYYCAFANSGEEDMAKALKNVVIHPRIQIEEKNGVSFAVSCRHCEEPLCVKSCITGALSVRDGLITVDKKKCVGCYTCILSCPYEPLCRRRGRRHPKMRAVYPTTLGANRPVSGIAPIRPSYLRTGIRKGGP